MDKTELINKVINPNLDKALKKADKSKALEDEIKYLISNTRTEEIKNIEVKE